MHDYAAWKNPAVGAKLDSMLTERHRNLQRDSKDSQVSRPSQTGLCISVYTPSKSKVAGVASHDWCFWSGLAVILLQILIASLPFFTSSDPASGDKNTLVITLIATILALVNGSLGQWGAEQWACRKKSPSSYLLTEGNGSQHAILILGNGHGLDLEDLANAGRIRQPPRNNIWTRISLATLAFSWIAVLFLAASMQNSWSLLTILVLGTVQNLFAGNLGRNPSVLGVHLDFVDVVGEVKVMDALLALEEKYGGAGKSLSPVFFPRGLRPEEKAKWEELKGLKEKSKELNEESKELKEESKELKEELKGLKEEPKEEPKEDKTLLSTEVSKEE
ncbi:MAG: hypothetical protein Q9226_004428 [Calogaya cf. arnoldii]